MSERFRFALECTRAASHWQLFEHLASTFLADEFDDLRTMASPAGDKGRDAMLQPAGDQAVALQYSVQADWEKKIRQTARRLADQHPQVTMLVYVSPLEIGAAADSVRKHIRKDFNLALDVRDRHYFVEREMRSASTATAASRYCRSVVDPILEEKAVISPSSSSLSSHESRAALLYLVLQREDSARDRQLTKLCFDALTKAALRETDNENRLSRHQIHDTVMQVLPTHAQEDVCGYTDRALERMTKVEIRHWVKEDEFCLTYEERTKLAEGLAQLATLNTVFEDQLRENLEFVAEGMELDVALIDANAVILRLRRVMERFLFDRGEAFADSVRTGQTMMFVLDELEEVAKDDTLRNPDTSSIRASLARLVAETIERTLRMPSDGAQEYLRAVAEGYTLLAFLREAPNVQSAISKLFQHGEIWLDTTAVLPLMAEDLLEPAERRYARIFAAARDAGVKLYISGGVLQEISKHLDACLRASRSPDTWRSRTPFLLAAYIWSGSELNGFGRWTQRFRGTQRPEEDLIDYLDEEQHIKFLDLAELADGAPDELRWHTRTYWEGVHRQRRPNDDPEIVQMLADHDCESFLGVIERRRTEVSGSPFGYSTWWLTFDSYAVKAAREISMESGIADLPTPVLSIDFLTYYLLVGPLRRHLERSAAQQLPLVVDQSILDALPADLMKAAAKAREDVDGHDDRLIRRAIRDHLDQEKLRRGPVARTGIEAIREDIRMTLEATKRH